MSHLLEKSHIYLCLSQSKYWNVKSKSMSQSKVKENARTITILQRTLFDVNFSRTDVNLYQSHWSVKSRSRSAGPTVYSKNMQRTVTMQCLITVNIAAEKSTLMLIVDLCNTLFKKSHTLATSKCDKIIKKYMYRLYINNF